MTNDTHATTALIEDVFGDLEGVTWRRMFGGFGLYLDGVIFGIVAEGEIYLKADAVNKGDFKERGSEQFTYESRGKTVRLPYWQLPEEVMHDPRVIAEWVERSARVTDRAKKPKPPKQEEDPYSHAVKPDPTEGPRAIIFDYFGVVSSEQFWAWAGENVADLEARREELRDLARQLDSGRLELHEFHKRLGRAANMTSREVARQFTSNTEVNWDMVNLVSLLHERYKTGLLTNASAEYLEPILEGLRLTQHFDDVLISSNVRLAKPDAQIFHLAVKRLGVVPERAVFIDDSQLNVDAAKAAGLDAFRHLDLPTTMTELHQRGVSFS